MLKKIRFMKILKPKHYRKLTTRKVDLNSDDENDEIGIRVEEC